MTFGHQFLGSAMEGMKVSRVVPSLASAKRLIHSSGQVWYKSLIIPLASSSFFLLGVFCFSFWVTSAKGLFLFLSCE